MSFTPFNANVNPETGLRYGYISGHSIHPELVDDLIWQHGTWHNDTQTEIQATIDKLMGRELSDEEQAELESLEQELENLELDLENSSITGEYQGVKYGSSMLGGALNFFIFFSPHVKPHGLCSPCVPNAGNLDVGGCYDCYDVPDDWRRVEWPTDLDETSDENSETEGE